MTQSLQTRVVRNGRPRRSRRQLVRRRWSVIVLALAAVGALAIAVPHLVGAGSDGPALTPLQDRIVSIAESQLGYKTDPTNTYCNRFSAFWVAGTPDCGNDNLDEEWCADFAAWVWREAGVSFVYQFINGDINSSSASFYEWGVAHHSWHPYGSGYLPRPGDIAVYGLDVSTMTAAHVAVVTSIAPGERGPNVINGDGDRTGFSVVESGTDQYYGDTKAHQARISGYVSP